MRETEKTNFAINRGEGYGMGVVKIVHGSAMEIVGN
jgi:hypothetical protein